LRISSVPVPSVSFVSMAQSLPIEVGVFDGNNGVSCWVTGVYAVVAANPPE
jgi:hypothetical protein